MKIYLIQVEILHQGYKSNILTSSRVNFQALRDPLADLWQPQAGIAITELGARRYLFRFFHKVDIDRITKRCPWDFQGHLIVLHRLTEGEIPLEVPLIYTEFWVQVHGLQSGLMTESMARQFGNFIGYFVEYDTSHLGQSYRPFMRIRVCLDVRVPLKRRKKIKVSDTFSYFARFQYEKLPLFCFICSRLGHGESLCPERLRHPDIASPFSWDNSIRATTNRQNQPRSRWLRNDDGSPLSSTDGSIFFHGSPAGSEMIVGETEDVPLTAGDGKKRQRAVAAGDGVSAPGVSSFVDSMGAAQGLRVLPSDLLADAKERPDQSS